MARRWDTGHAAGLAEEHAARDGDGRNQGCSKVYAAGHAAGGITLHLLVLLAATVVYGLLLLIS